MGNAFGWTVCLAASVLALKAEAKAPQAAPPGPLADYVTRADASYRWTKRREGSLGEGRFVELTLTSQTWRGIVWKHQLFIYKPKVVEGPKHAILWITGGAWHDSLARPVADDAALPREVNILAAAADRLKTPIAVVLNVPRQPILGGMVEDQAISYTFEQYLRTRDATWPLLLPMVKSVVRAMDAVQECVKREWKLDIEHFTVTGASKRGWTTWLTAAVDSRVGAIAPMVIDVLNMGPQMKHQVETWGRYSEQLHDYTRRGIQQYMNSTPGQSLRAIVDPYSYRKTLSQPKLILLGTNDRYWPLDSLNLYWNDLVGDKYVLYVPNNGHGLHDLGRVIGTISALHRHSMGQLDLPKLGWDLKSTGSRLELDLTSDKRPTKVSAWIATSATKDFRQSRWKSVEVTEHDGHFHHAQSLSDDYTALFGEAVFADHGLPYYLSTTVKIAGGTRVSAHEKAVQPRVR